MSTTPEELAESGDPEDQPQAVGPMDRLKLLPMTTPFGLRAAVLAGLVISAGVAASGGAGVFEDPAAAVATTPICSVSHH
ncbi:hypothetical protein KIPE111705_27685 [Kibdelosporangium persicum]|uniref:hypothetical protein n=1 Tax=Kibdelosporangium persicum TaxID=2698649 RepID=UPI0015634E6F|nr:hypothetical protein [Kibdelosporangium persicum]